MSILKINIYIAISLVEDKVLEIKTIISHHFKNTNLDFESRLKDSHTQSNVLLIFELCPLRQTEHDM